MQVLCRVTLTSSSAQVVAQTVLNILSIQSFFPLPHCCLSICDQGSICVAVQQTRQESNADDNQERTRVFLFSFRIVGSWSVLWHDVSCHHTNNCPQPKWGMMAQRKKWVTKTQRTAGSALLTIYLEASSRHRKTSLPPTKLIKTPLVSQETVMALSGIPITLSKYLRGKRVPAVNAGAALDCVRKSLWLPLGITWLTFYDWLKHTDAGFLGAHHRVIHKPTKPPAIKTSHCMRIRLCLINKARNTVGKFPAVRDLTCDNLPHGSTPKSKKDIQQPWNKVFFFDGDKSKSHEKKPACSQKTISWFGSHYLVDAFGKEIGQTQAQWTW